MECSRVEKLLYGYINKAIPDKLKTEIDQHLEQGCAACNTRWLEVQTELSKLEKMPVGLSTDFSAHKILQLARRRALWLRYGAMGFILLIFCIIIAIGLLLARYRYEHILIEKLEKAIFIYRLEEGNYPHQKKLFDQLYSIPKTHEYLKLWQERKNEQGQLCDYWGTAIIYRFPGIYNANLFDIYSFGINGKDDDGEWDDIKNWHIPR